MKRNLVKIDKKEFTREVAGKKVVELNEAYCAKCGYRLLYQVQTEGKGRFTRGEFYLDTACLCDTK